METIAVIAALATTIVAALAIVQAFRSRRRVEDLVAEKADIANELESAKALLDTAKDHEKAAQDLAIDKAKLQQQLVAANDRLEGSRANAEKLEAELASLRRKEIDLSNETASLRRQLSDSKGRLGERDDLEKRFSDAFKALSARTLEQQQETFKEGAEASLKAREEAVEKLVKPLSEKIATLDKARVAGESSLKAHIDAMMDSNKNLSKQAQSLASALTHRPQVRGQWGEMQVERALELSGLTKNIHYETQVSDGQGGRPDFIVHMPHNRDIVLDSKVSLNAYLDAQSADSDESREACMERHAQHVKNHAADLARREYWNSLPQTADFVVMVMPDFALPPAVERDPQLLDRALQNQVVIATHSTLVALLKCVSMGWQERTIADKASQIGELGKELHDRLSVYAGHIADVGKALGTAVAKYNASIGSFESRVMVQARRFPELGVSTTREIEEPKQVDTSVRPLNQLLGPGKDNLALPAREEPEL